MRRLAQPLTLWRCYSGILLLAAVAAVVWIVRADPPSFWQITWTLGIWLSANSGLPALTSSRRRDRLWWAAFITSIGAIITWTIVGLLEYVPWETPQKEIVWIGGSGVMVSAIYLSALLLLRGAPRDGPRLTLGRRAARVVLTILAVGWMTMVTLEQLAQDFDEDRIFWLIAAPAAVLTMIVLWLPAAASLDAAGVVETIEPRATLLGRCPRCQTEQSFARGNARCRGCGLRIIVDFEEPRCECGYLLYHLKSDFCPECGRSIEDKAPSVAGGEASSDTSPSLRTRATHQLGSSGAHSARHPAGDPAVSTTR